MITAADIRISVALVTRNRPEGLRRCLASLRAQTVQPHEIVVSDDSDSEHTQAIRAIAAESGARWQAGPRRGLYANRNAAALACTGTHIRTMDDDHTFAAGHFEQCLAAIRDDPRSVWTAGERSYLFGKHFADAPLASQLHPAGVGGPITNAHDNWAIADGATIYPRGVFDRGLRMVEAFGFGSSYLEFGAYLYQRGFRSRCLPGVMIEHHAEPATIGRTSFESQLFASLCFSCHFRPNPVRAMRYVLPQLARNPRLIARLPKLLQDARVRWSG